MPGELSPSTWLGGQFLDSAGKAIAGTGFSFGPMKPVANSGPDFGAFYDATGAASAPLDKQTISTERTTTVGTETTVATTTNRVNTPLIEQWAIRVAVFVLGFIFVAVGLTMFKPDIIPNPVRAIT